MTLVSNSKSLALNIVELNLRSSERLRTSSEPNIFFGSATEKKPNKKTSRSHQPLRRPEKILLLNVSALITAAAFFVLLPTIRLSSTYRGNSAQGMHYKSTALTMKREQRFSVCKSQEDCSRIDDLGRRVPPRTLSPFPRRSS
eukprot:scaffold2193_cov171-Amphora_coffeaeformis.AAC.16